MVQRKVIVRNGATSETSSFIPGAGTESSSFKDRQEGGGEIFKRMERNKVVPECSFLACSTS